MQRKLGMEQRASQPVFLSSVASRFCPWLPAQSSFKDELWPASAEGPVYQQPNGRWPVEEDGLYGMIQSWEDMQRNLKDVALDSDGNWRGQLPSWLRSIWWGNSHFSKELCFFLLQREYKTPAETSTSEILQLRLSEQCRRRGGKTVRARGPGCLLRCCLLHMTRKLHPQNLSNTVTQTRPAQQQH